MALRGVKVLEFAGLAPAPFCGMILRDHGATVTKIDRPNTGPNLDVLSRGKRSIIVDLKKPKATSLLTRLCSKADVVIDPYRPGVMEKWKLGPSDICKVNPRLIYARLTGFGQNGPYSQAAGHDINYIAISGVLSVLGKAGDKPTAPLNLLGDFGGGGLICALGICLALLEREKSGKGQVIDANMVEGSAYLSKWLWMTRLPDCPLPFWHQPKGKNLLDGGAHFYGTYKTKDDQYMAVGALEKQFYAQLLKGLNLEVNDYSQFDDWENSKVKFAEVFATKTQAEWCRIFDSLDACVTPVLPLETAHQHPHNQSKGSFIAHEEMHVPIPAPRMSRTPAECSFTDALPGCHSKDVLREEGFDESEIELLEKEKVIYSLKMKSSM